MKLYNSVNFLNSVSYTAVRFVTMDFIIQKPVLAVELTDLNFVPFSDFADSFAARVFYGFMLKMLSLNSLTRKG